MRVRALDKNDDWTFGRGRANYIDKSKAIVQAVKTRLRSFKNDWYLDIDHGIPWLTLLGRTNTERKILRAIEKTVLQTEGVLRVTNLSIIGKDDRSLRLSVTYEDVYGDPVKLESLDIFGGNPIIPPTGNAIFFAADGAYFWTSDFNLFTVPEQS